MTMLRADLLELGPEALTALANPGFVKRAHKDAAAGMLPTLCQDGDGTVHALFDDGVRTAMRPGVTLRDADCSCSASGMCRHRVLLVLAYQAAHGGAAGSAAGSPAAHGDAVPDRVPPDTAPAGWSPADFDDAAIAAAVTPQVLEQARRLALERPVVSVVTARGAGSVPAAHLPMTQVRFFSSTSLALARCDCRQGSACAHVVLAAWAFRQARARQPDAAEVMLEVKPPGAAAADDAGGSMDTQAAVEAREQVHDWLWSLWREGASQPLPGLEARCEALTTALSRLGWTWVRADLESVWQILQALAHRSNRYAIDDLVRSAAQCHLRLAGACHADAAPASRLPASRILGIGQPGEVALDLLRLVSLGATCWRDDASEGAAIVFADPDTQAACVLERAWPRSAQAADENNQLLSRRIAGHPLRMLAAGQVVTRSARRRANGAVELGTQARQTSVLALSPKAWDELRAPLRFDTLDALLQHVRSRPPAGIRSGETAGDWHVIGLAGVTLDHWAWDGVQQTLFARWYDGGSGGGGPIALRARLAYRSVTPGAVDALARALAGEWGALHAIAGPVWREAGGVAIQPASVLTERRVIVLALEPKAPQAMTVRTMPLAAGASEDLLRESFELLGQLLRQGLRHMPPSLRSRLMAQAERLDTAGYAHAARLLRDALADQRGGTGLATLSALGLLLDALQA
jgi:hypothetical protein